MSKSKVIITGGSGFLGKAVNKALKDNLFNQFKTKYYDVFLQNLLLVVTR